MSLQDLDPRWDNQTIEYDLEKHNWPEFWLAVAKEKFPNIESLETVHKTLDVKEVSQLGAYLQQRTGDADFIERVDAYYQDVAPELLYDDEWMLQRFFTIRMVIPISKKLVDYCSSLVFGLAMV